MSGTETDAETKNNSRYWLRSEVARLDGIDAAILRELCTDARMPRAELSRRVGLSAPIQAIRGTPQIVACDRVSGEDCFVARAHVRDVAEMEAVIDRIVPFGATNSSIVQSSPVEERLVEL
jgi:Lrp/AsnC family leucine-responsive transcriptional regulator